MLLYTDKIFSIFMYAQTGDNQVSTLEAPSKSFGYACVTSSVIESKDDPTQMTKAVIYNYILYYIQKTIHSKHICKNVHS